MPVRTAPRRTVTLDPVTLEILWTRLVSIVDEAAATFVRTSFSTLVRESNDFAVVLTDREGHSIAQSSMSIPSFIGTMPATVRHVLARFPAATLRPGDAIITNDPWLGTGHIHDMSMAMPLFHGRKLVAFAGIVSHLPDIGGRVRNQNARDIFEEGLQVPPAKFLSAGKPETLLHDVIARNVRTPETVLGDLWAQVAAGRMMQSRLDVLLAEGVDVDGLSAAIRSRSERAMRRAIRALPDGTYRSELTPDGYDTPLTVQCALTVQGERIDIDFAGSSQQIARAVNVVPIYTFAYSAYAVKALLSPTLPNNEGSFVPIRTHAPEGSVLNPRYPAATGARHMIGHLLPPVVIAALSQALPARAMSEGATHFSLTMAGSHGGRPYTVVNFMNSGQAATASRPGHDVLSFPSNLSNTPIEVLETLAPLRVRERSRRRGSGGTGRQRGGDGQVFEFEMVGDQPALLAFMSSRTANPARGVAGGGPGALGRALRNGTLLDPAEPHLIQPGDVVRVETPGAGGYGAP